jgi:DNA modification methylase
VDFEKNQILIGDSREILKNLPRKSVDCVITSPPYYGLRDYGNENQIGLENSPNDFIEQLCLVFDEVWNVLKDNGTLWVNLGDTYSSHKDCKSVGQSLAKGTSRQFAHVIEKGKSITRNTKLLKAAGLKNKDLIGIPWRFAFAMQDRGWYLRQDIIWSKPNPMPESVTDRCTKSHEYVFLLTKSDRYYFNNQAIKEQAVTGAWEKTRPIGGIKHLANGNSTYSGNQPSSDGLRNKRSVWTINTKPFKKAHFAVMPEALVEPCILAGCPEKGTVLDPFFGAGTVGLVALKNNRTFVGVELNPDYVEIAKNRINQFLETPTQTQLPVSF